MPIPGRRRPPAAGQSLTEFALLLPILLILFLAIVDFARLFSTMIAVESAVREAADFGAQYQYNWTAANTSSTVAEMQTRACVSTRNLPDYVGSAGVPATCTNPAFAYQILPPTSAPALDLSTCPDRAITDEPCRVRVTLGFVFELISPVNIQFFDVQLGLPSQVGFERSSTFAISRFEIDLPTPTP